MDMRDYLESREKELSEMLLAEKIVRDTIEGGVSHLYLNDENKLIWSDRDDLTFYCIAIVEGSGDIDFEISDMFEGNWDWSREMIKDIYRQANLLDL